MKVLVGAFNQEKALVGAFSVITNLLMELFEAIISTVYSGVQTFMAFMLDEKPEWTQHRLKILIGSSAVYFLLALPMCSKVAHKLRTLSDLISSVTGRDSSVQSV